MFVDRIKVFAQAGSGGRGSVSFRREKFVPKGGPDGGDGGRGGDIILKADSHVDNLSSLFYEPLIKAKNGGHGMGKKMFGRSAPNKVVKVPVGTMVFQAGEKENAEHRTSNIERRIEEEEAGKRSLVRRSLDEGGTPNEEEEERSTQLRQGYGGQAPNAPSRTGKRSTLNERGEPLVDLARDGQEYLLAKGGKGGKGNVHFKSSRN